MRPYFRTLTSTFLSTSALAVATVMFLACEVEREQPAPEGPLDGGRPLDGGGGGDGDEAPPDGGDDAKKDGFSTTTIAGNCSLVWGVGGTADRQRLGEVLAVVEDTNADGVEDIVTTRSSSAATMLVLLSGRDGAVLKEVDLPGEGFFTLSRVGDLDGDGISEVALPRSGSGGAQTGLIVSPGTGTLLVTLEAIGGTGSLSFAPFGGAANPRVLVGAPNNTGAPSSEDRPGKVLVLSKVGVVERTIAAPTSVSPSSLFGQTVSQPGDLNGDGVTDIVVSDPYAADFFGRVIALSSANGAVLWTFDGASAEVIGDRVIATRDLDGDGVDDTIIGAHNRVNNPVEGVPQPPQGALIAVSGRTGHQLWTLAGRRPGDALGMGLGTIDDIDGDGVADIVGGSPNGSMGDVIVLGANGSFSIASGKTGKKLVEIQSVPETEKQSTDGFGSAVAGLRDTRGEGGPRVVVTAPFAGKISAQGSSDRRGLVTVWNCRP